MNYEIFRCPTVSTFIYGKSNVISNWTRQNLIYFWALLLTCYILQGRVTGILQEVLVLFLIQANQNIRHIFSHKWNILRNKIQRINFLIQILKLNSLKFINSATLPRVVETFLLLIGSTLS